jgi:hypothetical protein
MTKSSDAVREMLVDAYETLDGLFLDHLASNPKNKHDIRYGPYAIFGRSGYRYTQIEVNPLFIFDEIGRRPSEHPHNEYCFVGLTPCYAASRAIIRSRMSTPELGGNIGDYYPTIQSGDSRIYKWEDTNDLNKITVAQRLDGDVVSEKNGVFYWDFSKVASHPDFKLLRYAWRSAVEKFAEDGKKIDEIMRRNPEMSRDDLRFLMGQRIIR